MKFLKAISWVLFFCTSTAFAAPAALDNTISVISMNLKWYGSTHFAPHNDDERDIHLKEFFKTYYSHADIFLFQEITNPKRLEGVLGSGFKCLTFENKGAGFQYVVACYDKSEVKPLIPNSEMFSSGRSIDISFGSFGLRNALSLEFESIKNPKKKLQTLNVHLRSMPQHSEFRTQQMAALFDEVKSLKLDEQNLVIGGDLNAFGMSATKREQDDIYYFFDEAEKRGLDLFTEFDLPTHLNGRSQRNFDYLIVNNSKWLNSYDLFTACSAKASTKIDSYENAKYFSQTISDHCPISIDININSL